MVAASQVGWVDLSGNAAQALTQWKKCPLNGKDGSE